MKVLSAPWPWYVAGPLIGLMVPMLLWLGNRSFGISQNLEHLCAITQPRTFGIDYFRYGWRRSTWSVVFMVGVVLGGFLAGVVFANPDPVALSAAAREMFAAWGLSSTGNELLPPQLFSFTPRNALIQVLSGVLVGFGTRYAAGCTSGHAITGLATGQPQSLLAVAGIFAGGMTAAHFIVPYLGH
ncbi:MAG: YeeE/YedE family protein [Gammaproteobacteria bacterium]|nr:YeeE/YedE family protein [Gammaproteobacteria bacterium]